MPRDNFPQRKKDVLSKKDKSSKDSWDKKIKSLCKKINSFENYYTTSSCSGRIVLMIDEDKKGPELFKVIIHDLIDFDNLKRNLEKIAKNNKSLIKFKQEPCIIHIACQTLKDAEEWCKKAQLSGWKRSGIISFGRRFIVELNSTEKLEFPIINKNKIIVSDEFLKLIIKKSNENLKKSWGKIEKLESYLS